MDYSSFFAPPAQPYQFFSLPEKPQQTYTPPTEVQDPLGAFNDLNDPNAYPIFDQKLNFDGTPFIPTTQSPQQNLNRHHSISNGTPVLQGSSAFDRPGSIVNDSMDTDPNNPSLERSSDDDKESLTPAQSRRKAQNRAAQRAFRERKEKHVKELEIKLKSIEAQSTDLLTDNERLRRELERLQTQNEILRATSTPKRLHGQPQRHDSAPEALETGPMAYSPKSFNAAFAKHEGSEEVKPHMITLSPTGERLLATGAAWDYIHTHPSTRNRSVDLSQVVDRLRDQVVCNGNGPSFPESAIEKAIAECEAVPGDELI